MKARFKKIFKWVLILGLLSGACFWTLAVVGGNGDEHREIVEGYLEDVTGLDAQVGQLNALRFFPTVIVHFEDLRMRAERSEEEAEIEATQISVAKIYMAVDFSDMIFRSGKFRALGLLDFKALAGAVFEEALSIERLGIEHTDEETAFLMGHGMLGERRFTIRTPVTTYGTLPKVKYRFNVEDQITLIMEDGTRLVFAYEGQDIVLKPES